MLWLPYFFILEFYILLSECSIKIFGNGLVLIIRVGKSIQLKWVNLDLMLNQSENSGPVDSWLEKEKIKFKKGYSKTCLKPPLKKMTIIGFQDWLSLNAGQKYCRMLQSFCNTFDLH